MNTVLSLSNKPEVDDMHGIILSSYLPKISEQLPNCTCKISNLPPGSTTIRLDLLSSSLGQNKIYIRPANNYFTSSSDSDTIMLRTTADEISIDYVTSNVSHVYFVIKFTGKRISLFCLHYHNRLSKEKEFL